MWSVLILGLVVGLTCAANGWKPGTEYRYEMQGRTLVGKDSHFNGVKLGARITVKPVTESILSLKISEGHYGGFSGDLSEGWDSKIPEGTTSDSPLPFTKKPFELELKNGMVEKLMVEEGVPTWEVNMIKAIASAFQLDLKPENLKKSRFNKVATSQEPVGFYKTVEDTITGKCETIYEVAPVAEELLEKWPEMAPFPGDGQLIGITKTQNYSDCHKKSVYHSGITGYSDWEPSSTRMGQFMSRINVGRIVISGNFQRYIFQSSVLTNKIVVSPHLYNVEKVIVGSRINLTLEGVAPTLGDPVGLIKPQIFHDLAYEPPLQTKAQEPVKTEKFLWFGSGTNTNVIKETDSDKKTSSESESVQEEEEEEKKMRDVPSMDEPFLIPFDPSVRGKNVDSAIAMASKTGRDPSLFIALVRLLRTMTEQEIHQVAEPLRTSGNPSWWAIRDGVAEAGSGPALLVLKEWISSGKVKGEEAAELITQLPNSALYPTQQYIHTFYTMISSPPFESQQYLNWTGVLAFSDLVRMAVVDRREAGNMYPRHWFGRPAPANLTEIYLPLLKSRLEAAIADKDSPRIQLYIRAIGNMAHPKILSIFESYIEGRQNISNFQRLCMVASLDRVAKVYSKEAMTFLYRVYRNVTDTSEVRVAAVMHLMKTNPPMEMLQRMAEFTHSDPSPHVNSVVDSAIRSAAKLTSPRSYVLAQGAKAALGLLPQIDFENDYSKHYIRAYLTKEQNLGYKQDFTYIKNENDFLPNSMFYYIRRQMGGYKLHYKQLGAMWSSSEDLLQKLGAQFKSNKNAHINIFPTTWNSEKVAKMMKLEIAPNPQLEGNAFFGLLGGYRFFPFDNTTIQSIPEVLRNFADSIAEDRQFNHSKFYNQFSMTIGYPTITGLPFMYTIDIPTILNFKGKIQAMTQPDIRKALNKRDPILIPQSINMSAELNLLYSLKTQSQTGFYTPFDQKHYFLGLDKNTQINIPIRLRAGINIQETGTWAELEPLPGHEKQKIFEHSTALFTARQNTRNLGDPAKTESVHLILSSPTKKYNTKIGKNSMSFEISVESEKTLDSAMMMKWLRGNDFITAWLYHYAENNPTNNNITIIYNPNTSQTKTARFGFNMAEMNSENEDSTTQNDSQNYKKYKKHRNISKHRKENEPSDGKNRAIPNEVGPESIKRQNYFLREAMKNIQNSSVRMINMFAKFNGTKDSYYVSTIAHAKSVTSEKSRILIFIGKYLTNTERIQAAFDMNMNFPKIPLMDYREAMKVDPTSYINALVDMRENDSPWNQMNIKGEFKRTLGRETYTKQSSAGRHCEIEMSEGNYLLPACRNATLSASILDQISVTFNYKEVPTFLKEATSKIYQWISYLGFDYLSQDSMISNTDGMVSVKASLKTNMRELDATINTPSLSANFSLVPINKWVEPMVYIYSSGYMTESYAQEFLQGRTTCVLDQKAVTTFKNVTYAMNLDKGWHVMLQHIPKSWKEQSGTRPEISVLVRNATPKREMRILLDNEIIDIKPGQVYDSNRGEYEISELPGGVIQFIAPSYSFQALYDGTRILLQVGKKYMGEVYGLCGRTINFNQCKLEEEMEEPCTYFRISVIEDQGRLCFSSRPQLQCAQHCQSTSSSIQKTIDFHCVADTPVARHWVDMVKKGANPDFSNKGVNFRTSINLPEKCSQK